MKHDVVILVPRRADHGWRDRLWAFTRDTHWEQHYTYAVFEGTHNDGPFNRSAAINRAAENAGDWKVAVIIDADVLVHHTAVHTAVEAARYGVPVVAYDCKRNLTRSETMQVLEGKRPWQSYAKAVRTHDISGAYVVHRELWDLVGGFDENFNGWGWEDVAFRIATETMSEHRLEHVPSTIVHLWHPPSPEQGDPTLLRNHHRVKAYQAAHWHTERIGLLCGS